LYVTKQVILLIGAQALCPTFGGKAPTMKKKDFEFENMKKLLFLSLFVLASFTTMAQTLPYRSYAEFNGDIGAYLKYNFEDRGNLYQGKTIGDLLKDVELTPIGYSPTLAELKEDGQTYMICIDIYFKNKIKGKFNPLRDDYLTIYLEPYVLWSELENQYKKNEGDKWTQQDYEVIKNKKIKVVLYQYT
jgi:hypothetical protein